MNNVLAKVNTPLYLRYPARLLGAGLFVFTPIIAFLPWQQSIVGSGRVIAFLPNEREQVVEAPVKGRVLKWHVPEGAHVKAGDLLVELSDIDPNYLNRLAQKKLAVEQERDAATQQAEAYHRQEKSYESARELALQAAGFKVDMAKQKVLAAEQKVRAMEVELETAKKNLERLKALVQDGLRSQRDYELAILAEAKASTELNQSRANLSEAKAQEVSLQAERIQKGAEFAAKIASSDAAARKADAEVAKAEKTLAEVNVDVARQAAQRVSAPRDGIILDVIADQGGEVVKEGDPLALLIPNTESRAVELWVDGNDAPLISEGRVVRLQFEGWPAVQFVGWPSAAVGTFGGRVSFVDAMGRKSGKFRVLVVPPEEDAHWPEPRFLRQGVKAKGWVLLNQVSIGFELWRQFNGFPVSLDPSELEETERDKNPGKYTPASKGSKS